MSRCATALYGKPERHAQNDGLELFIVQGGFAFDGGQEGRSVARFLTAFANFDAGPKPLILLPELSGSMVDVLEHCHVLPWKGLRSSTAELLSGYPASTLNLVVQLPARGRQGLTPESVDDALDCFVESTKHSPRLIIGIAQRPEDWQGMRNLEHFVAASAPAFDRDVATLFKAVAGLMAPVAIADADEEDLRRALGDAQSPARLAHANWSHDEETLTFLSEEDQALVAGSESQFLVSFYPEARVGTAKKLIGGWRKTCRDGAFLGLSITAGFYEEALGLHSNCSQVVAVCASGSRLAALENKPRGSHEQ